MEVTPTSASGIASVSTAPIRDFGVESSDGNESKLKRQSETQGGKRTKIVKKENIPHMFASEIDEVEVRVLFHPEYVNLPDQENPIGKPIQGADAWAVMEEIIKQLHIVDFNFNSLEQFQTYFANIVSDDSKKLIEEFTDLMNDLFAGVHIDSLAPESCIPVYRQIRGKVETMMKSEVPYLIAKCFNAVHDVMTLFIGESLRMEGNDPLQKALTRLLSGYINMGPVNPPPIGEVYQQTEVLDNGRAKCQFPFKISEEDLQAMDDASKETIEKLDLKRSRGGPSPPIGTSTSSTSITSPPKSWGKPGSTTMAKRVKKAGLIQCVAVPDLTVLTRVRSANVGKIRMTVEVKGPTSDVFVAALRGRDSVSTDAEDAAGDCARIPRSRKIGTRDERQDMKKMRTQHFVQLLCALKDQNDTGRPCSEMPLRETRCFGIFCVLHRLFITNLSLVKSDKPGLDENVSGLMDKGSLSLLGEAASSKQMNEIPLRLASTDYLDIFNPVHIEALLKIMAVIIAQPV